MPAPIQCGWPVPNPARAPLVARGRAPRPLAGILLESKHEPKSGSPWTDSQTTAMPLEEPRGETPASAMGGSEAVVDEDGRGSGERGVLPAITVFSLLVITRIPRATERREIRVAVDEVKAS